MTTIGNYEVIRKIGEGGFAKTYEARHLHLPGKKACLKKALCKEPAYIKILEDEVSLLWDLNHHSLPAMKDFFFDKEGYPVIAMSFIDGKNIEELVTKNGPIEPEDVSWIMQRLLQGLYFLHHEGVIHSDVKPQNVIIRGHNAILVDYGLSIFRPTAKSAAIGYTEAFAAPELTQGKPPLPESDLYGAGITMLYALGGDHMAKTYPKHVPPQLIRYCDDLLHYDPLRRPNWDKIDLVKRLSDIRLDVFGRRHSSDKPVR